MKNKKKTEVKIDVYLAEQTVYELGNSTSTTLIWIYMNNILFKFFEASFSHTENVIEEFISERKKNPCDLYFHSVSNPGGTLDLNVHKMNKEPYGSFEYKGKKYSCFVISRGYKETNFSEKEIDKLSSRIEDRLK